MAALGAASGEQQVPLREHVVEHHAGRALQHRHVHEVRPAAVRIDVHGRAAADLHELNEIRRVRAAGRVAHQHVAKVERIRACAFHEADDRVATVRDRVLVEAICAPTSGEPITAPVAGDHVRTGITGDLVSEAAAGYALHTL